VKQKENIFEELNKMRSLIHAKAGVVISEQANAGADVGAIMQELNKNNSDEQKIVNIVKKYKDKASFKAFTDQYKTISGKDFGTDVYEAIEPYNDKTEWNDLKTHLGTMGITLGNANTGGTPQRPVYSATFAGLDTPAAANTDDAWKTTYSCVTTQPGAKAVKTNNAGTAYLVGQIYYYVNGRKKLADGTMKNYSCSTEFKSRTANSGVRDGGTGRGNSQVVTDYSKQIQSSLGSSPTGKMSSQDLDLILKRLNGEDVSVEVRQELPKDVNGKPDLDKILASLQN
jgi:hypothetical protein